jgi:adenylate cyclase
LGSVGPLQPFKKLLIATAVGISVFVLIVVIHQSGYFTVAELKTLDHRFQRYADPASARKDIVLIAIDEASLETFGRWPWPRDRHGYLVHYLKQAGAKAIVFDILFLEPDEAAEEFDAAFAEETRSAGNVYLPFLLQSATSPDLAAKVSTKAEIPVRSVFRDNRPARAQGAKLPIPSLADAAAGLGFINMFPDQDGVTRRLPLLAGKPLPDQSDASQLRKDGDARRYFTHLVTAVARGLVGAQDATLHPRSLQLDGATIPLTAAGDMVIDWHGTLEQKTFQTYSAGAVLRSFSEMQRGMRPFLDPALFQGKIVFVAGTAAGTYDLRVTPLSSYTPGVLIHMTALDNILQRRHMQKAPEWVFLVSTLGVCTATAWLFIMLKRQTLKFSLIVAVAGAYYGAAIYAFIAKGLWVELAFPEGGLAVTFAVAATVEYLTEGRQRRLLRSVFDRYMAPDVVDEIMRHPQEITLGGEKKELTVLFSDIAGFTTISESLRPEDLVEFLNRYLSAMTDVILQHRGNVNKYLGDGIMAIFGAPRGDPAHATLACYTALESQRTLARLRELWKSEGHPEIFARIGINTGDLVVGNMGSQARMEYTAMGDSVNLASRLEGANKFYDTQILLGRRTYELARHDIEAREVDLLRVKGKNEPVVVYELLARKGELDSIKARLIERYLQGLADYKARNFAQAGHGFEAALELDPKDGPSRVYLTRTQQFLASPPAINWDGVYELRSK